MLFRWIISPYLTWFTLFRASWHAASVSVIAQSLGLVVVLIASRGLGAEQYGKVGVIGAYFGWFGLLIGYGVSARLPSLLAQYRHQPQKQAQACATVLALTLLFTIAGTLLALIALPFALPRLHLAGFTTVALLYAVFFALLQVRIALDSISQFSGWMQRWSASNLAATISPVILLGGLLLEERHFSAVQYMDVLLLTSILATLFTFRLFLQGIGGWSLLCVDRALVRPLLMAGRGPWLSLLSATLVTYGVPLLIVRFLEGKENVAYFNIIISVNNWVALVGMGVSLPVMAKWSRLAAERRLPELRRELRQFQMATGVVITTASLLMAIFAVPFVHLLYGPGYDAVIPLFRLVVPSTAVSGFGGWYYIALFSLGHPGGVGMPNFVYAIPVVALSFLALSFTSLGVSGTVIAIDLGIFLWILMYEIMFRRAYRLEMAADMEK